MSSASSYSNLVQELYVAYFGRPADYFGLQNFEAALAAANAPTDPAALATAYSTSTTIKSLVDSFGTSGESTTLYGSGSTESFVNAIFENLFNRPAAVSGLSFWVNAIESGAVTKGDAALAILAGAFSNSSTQGVADQTLINNKISVATNFTTDLGTSSNQIVAYAGATAAQDARLMLAGVTGTTDPATFNVQTTINNIVAGNTSNTYNLTANVDSFIGGTGNNVFNAILDNAAGLAAGGQAATLQSFDSIIGGTLNNTLNITDFGVAGGTASGFMTIPSGATISGITTLNVNTLEGVNGDFSSWTGLTALDIKSANGTVSLTVPDAAVVNVNDTSGTISVSGGSTITAKTNTTNEIIINGGAKTSAVSLTGGVYNEIVDINHGSGKANTITTVSLTANGVNGQYSYTTIDSDALTTLNVTNEATGVYIDAAAGTRTLTVNLDGNGPGYVSSSGAWIEDNTATTLIVNAVNNASNIYFQANSATSVTFNDAVDLTLSEFILENAKTVTITGAGDFTANLSDGYATAAVDATAASGVVTVTLAAGQSFAGGSGQDIVSIGASQTGTVAGGSAADNEIVLNNAGTATVADIASVTHFSTFGVNGNTQGVFDMSKVSGYTAYDVQGAGGNVTFTNVANNSTLSIEAGNISSDIITLQAADANGATDSATVNLGSASDVPFGITVGQITLEDSGFVGMANVTINNLVGGSEVHNTITKLDDNNIVSLNLTGSGELTIGTLDIGSPSLTVNNSIAGHSSVTANIQTLTDNHLTTLTIGGTSGFGIGAFDSTVTGLTIVDNNAAAVEISGFADTALKTATFTNSVNTTAATFAFGGTLSEPSLATLNLNGNVELSIAGDTVTTGITLAGGTDNATVTINFGEVTASGATDSITLGNGAGDSVTLGAGDAASTQTVVLGNGAGDSIVSASAGAVNATVGSATTGTDTITANSASSLHATAGNGTNVISDTAAGATIAITAGTGANTITVGDNSSGTISLGAHSATTVDAVTIGVSGTSLTAIEKISGLANANVDTLTFSGDANALTFAQVTAGSVVATGGNTTLLADWVAAADGLGGVVAGAAHNVTWFQFQGNTYLLESVAGQTADAGTMVAGNTLVELVGTGYKFGHATATTTAGGVVHLVG